MSNVKSKYDIQAEEFLKKTGIELTIKFLKHAKHFADDKEERDIYEVILKRKSRSMRIEFGNSINDSGFYVLIGRKKIPIDRKHLNLSDSKIYMNKWKLGFGDYNFKCDKIHRPEEPTAYDVLTCLTKYDPGTLEDFCSEFGYDTDSKKAEKTYVTVKEEWLQVCSLFSDEELSELQEIS